MYLFSGHESMLWSQYWKLQLGLVLELFGLVLRLSLVFHSGRGILLAKSIIFINLFIHLLRICLLLLLLLILFKMQYDILITYLFFSVFRHHCSPSLSVLVSNSLSMGHESLILFTPLASCRHCRCGKLAKTQCYKTKLFPAVLTTFRQLLKSIIHVVT